ncbi:MAG: hypothetical protein RIQ81_1544 [Pseudomonadota bacterium]
MTGAFAFLVLGMLGSGSKLHAAATARGGELRPKVVVSVPPLFLTVREIAGNDFDVIAGLPAGRSEHGHEPSAKDVKLLKSANLLVFVDEATDGWMLKLAGSIPRIGVLPAVKPMTYADTTGEALGVATRSLGSKLDPHFWTDPVRMGLAAMAVASRLHALKPGTAVERRASEFNARMQELSVKGKQKATSWQGKTAILSHASLGYMSSWTGLKVVGLLEPVPHVEPGPRHLRKLVAVAKTNAPCHVLAEEQLDRKTAGVLSAEAGIKVSRINPLGSSGGSSDVSGAYDRYLLGLVDEISGAFK